MGASPAHIETPAGTHPVEALVVCGLVVDDLGAHPRVCGHDLRAQAVGGQDEAVVLRASKEGAGSKEGGTSIGHQKEAEGAAQWAP